MPKGLYVYVEYNNLLDILKETFYVANINY